MVKLLDFPPIAKDEQVTGGLLASMLGKIANAIRSPGPTREATRKVTVSGPVLPSDAYLYVDTTAGAVTLTLPLASTALGQRIEVKLIAGTNALTVQRTAPDVIDTTTGVASIVWSTIGDSYVFQSVVDATAGHWHIAASYPSSLGVFVGTPKTPAVSFIVPTNYFLDQIYRLTLTGAMRATLQGTADLILTDDFGTRSRIVLAGRG